MRPRRSSLRLGVSAVQFFKLRLSDEKSSQSKKKSDVRSTYATHERPHLLLSVSSVLSVIKTFFMKLRPRYSIAVRT